MATVIEPTDQEIAELKQLTNQDDVATAIRTAMTEYLRHVRRMRLKELSGQVEMQDNGAELENDEVKSSNDDPGPGTD